MIPKVKLAFGGVGGEVTRMVLLAEEALRTTVLDGRGK